MEFLPPVVLELRANASQVFAEMDEVKAATAQTAQAADASATRVTSATEKSAKGFSKISKWAGLGAVGVAVASTMMASTFQQKMNLLSTAADEPAAKVKAISAGVLDLAQSTGTSVDQLAEGAYTVSKAMGSQGAAAQLLVLKAAAQGAKAENVDLATATNALTSVMMSYHEPASKAVQVENELIAASGKSKTTMSDFAGALSTVIPVASAAHISFAQVGGAIATLTQHGTSADEATQELSSTIRSLQAPNAVASKAMQQLGLNVVDVESKLGQRGVTGTFSLISDAIQKKMGPSGLVVVNAFKQSQSATADLQTELSKMPASLQKLSSGFEKGTVSYKEYYTSAKALGGQQYEMAKGFISTMSAAKGFNNMLSAGNPAAQTFAGYLKQVMGGATGMNTALMLGGENMKTFTADTKTVGEAAQKTGSNVSSWAKTQRNAKVQMDMLGSTVQVLAIRLGNMLLPVVTSVTKAATGWLEGLQKGNPAVVTITIAVGALAAALVVGAAAVTAYNTVQGISAVLSGDAAAKTMLQAAALGMVRGAQVVATAAQWAWNAAMDADPIMLIILAVAALIAIIVLLVTHWKQVTEFLTTAWKSVASFFVTVGKGIADWWNAFWDGVAAVLKAKWDAVVNFLRPAISLISDIFQVSVRVWTDIFIVFAAVVKTVWDGIMFVLGPIIRWMSTVITFEIRVLLIVWTAVWNAIRTVFTDVWNGLVAFFTPIVKWISDAITVELKTVQTVWNTVWGAVSSFFTGIWNGIVNGVRTAIGTIASVLNGIRNTVMRPFEDVGTWLVDVGRNLIQGLINGVGDAMAWLKKTITGLGSNVLSWAKGVLGIHSPSTEFAFIGQMIGQGLVNGITSTASTVQKAMTGLVQVPSVPAVTVPGSYSGAETLPGATLTGQTPMSARVIQAVMASVTAVGGTSTNTSAAVASGGGRASNTVTVITNTNASPQQIASSVGWELRRRG